MLQWRAIDRGSQLQAIDLAEVTFEPSVAVADAEVLQPGPDVLSAADVYQAWGK